MAENKNLPLVHLTWDKLYYVIWTDFKCVNGFLVGGLFMAENKNLRS
jgi:hypothetical protein